MKYSREGPRDFIPFEYEEVTIDNIKKACQKHFKEHRDCDVLASEQGPSCSRIDQLPSLKIISIRFTNDLSRKRLFPEISSFSKTDFSRIPSKHPKSFSVVSKQVNKRFASVFPRSLSAADMLRLGTLIRKENKNDVKVVVESFDIAKKEWKTVTEAYFEIEEMHFAECAFRKAYMAKCSTYPFKNKQLVIKKLNQSTVTELNVFEESSEPLTRKSVQMNTLVQYMAKSFQGKHFITTAYTMEK